MWILMLIMKLNVAMVLGPLLLTINQVTARVGRPSPGHWLEVEEVTLGAGVQERDRDLPECLWPERLVTRWGSLGAAQSPLPPGSSLLQLPNAVSSGAASSSPILELEKAVVFSNFLQLKKNSPENIE
uniref:Uncharacterized protein n=1 Tax=Myotis myotis TaxID=51298 RepID=A0A7J8AN09_MYOMY|nr:hypothetical protein mMyoMyo1_008203 [Myotis myotis]